MAWMLLNHGNMLWQQPFSVISQNYKLFHHFSFENLQTLKTICLVFLLSPGSRVCCVRASPEVIRVRRTSHAPQRLLHSGEWPLLHA